MKLKLAIAVAMLALAGCASGSGSSPSASPAWTPQAECERNGGWWRASMNYCEYQAPGGPLR